MKKITLTIFLAFFSFSVFAQEEQDTIPNGWKKEGTMQLLFNQSAFNDEWTGGGTSNIAGNFLLDYKFNYKMDDFTWDNRILFDYGLTKQRGDDFARKTSDRLEFHSIAGKQIQESLWYYSFFINFRTQITKGYEFSEDADTGETIRTEKTHFLSPAYIQAGPGFLWKKNDDLYVNAAPATARLILVDKDFTSVAGYEDGDYFGVDEGESARFELGFSLTGFAKFDVMENVSISNLLQLYSNYLEDPQNVDIDYTMNANLKINEYLSTNLIFQAIYDDNAVKGFQIREVFGLGFNYKL